MDLIEPPRPDFNDLQVRAVRFDELVDYWRETRHFPDEDKVYTEVLGYLGPFQRTVVEPRRISYGLFHGSRMMGATHVTEWSEEWIRFRTINIRPEYRGLDLGWQFLDSVLKRDWADRKTVFGWFRREALGWAEKHGFRELDGILYGNHKAAVLTRASI